MRTLPLYRVTSRIANDAILRNLPILSASCAESFTGTRSMGMSEYFGTSFVQFTTNLMSFFLRNTGSAAVAREPIHTWFVILFGG
ncbi:hypothetical protein ATCV1_z220R [Acanthocystis turfacea chlorella virus 1]|uniref:Uncharacterized protein z220R n=1 Tax=Chlorovirus heliozoae TaxID=322019 RepID=A7K8I0_9PHYC|nr:hypothetical protein ATCV1_z220R [Acanthocystis turfacea chlorella virus 1]ABT16354.1 hypothetical protein ATCV1_z220R [Acanthocystis turfacea chlorella virus 1]